MSYIPGDGSVNFNKVRAERQAFNKNVSDANQNIAKTGPLRNFSAPVDKFHSRARGEALANAQGSSWTTNKSSKASKKTFNVLASSGSKALGLLFGAAERVSGLDIV